jgi:murein DD-endopeptidase MepM/ murein hydrolase activator NlpD
MDGRDRRQDVLVFVGVIFFGFMILNVLKDQGWVEIGEIGVEKSAAASGSEVALADSPSFEGTGGLQPQPAEISLPAPIDANAIAAPYERFAITQGIHGADYGHMAIDISAGKGATIHSPINGEVTALFIDEWGNPSLIIENARYKIELLHGLYTVKVGDRVAIGQPIGTESNQGNVADPWGFSCRNRDCGYHTHINVYDKDLGSNVNPLDLFHSQ